MMTHGKRQTPAEDSHPAWETLNDFADDTLAADASSEVGEHLKHCVECRALVSRLRALLSLAGTARDVDAPPEAWSAIRRDIDRRKEIALRGAEPVPTEVHITTTRRIYLLLAAAAVVLVTLSSLTTIAIMRGRYSAGGELAQAPGAVAVPTAASLPTDLVALEREYLITVSDLSATLESPNAKLAPETVSTVRRSLAIIDSAIAEARGALLADPASGFLRGVLARNYQQKIDLLRRATERAEAP